MYIRCDKQKRCVCERERRRLNSVGGNRVIGKAGP